MALSWWIKLKSRLRNDNKPQAIFYGRVKLLCAAMRPSRGRWRHPRASRRMTSSHGLHLKTYVLILFIILFAPLGNVLLSKGMKNVDASPCKILKAWAAYLCRCLRRPTSGWALDPCCCFSFVPAGAFVGRLQFRAAGIRYFLRRGGLARAFRAERVHHAYALDRRACNMFGGAGGG